MADYQSLLTRAVANLPPTSPASARQAIYDRARKALVTQLRSLRPPLPEADIAREESALDAAIAAVEAKLQAAPEGVGAAVPPSAAAPAPAAPSAAAPPPAAPPAQPANPAAPPPRPATPTAPAARPAPPARPAAPGPRPSEALPARVSVPPPPPRPAAPAVSAQPSPTAGAAAPKPPPPVHVQPQGPGGEAPPVAPPPPGAERSEADGLAAVVPGEEARAPETSLAPPVVASRDEDEAADAPALEPPAEGGRLVAPGRPEAEALRPVAPSLNDEPRRTWPWAVLAVVVGVVLSIAVVAILMRQKPQDLAIAPPAPAPAEAPQTPAKIAQRAQSAPEGGDSAAGPAPPAGQAAPDATAPAAPQPAPAEPALPPAARAAMLVASADNPQKPVVNLGSTVWSTIPAPPGQPAGVAVEADADIPDLKMHASMILRKNSDPTLQATHTIDLKFTFQDGAPITGFKDVGLPQVRKADSTGSEALNSVKVKISDDYFLFALAKGDQDSARNIDLMQTRAWFDFPLLLNDNRIAKLVFQKSAEGEAMLQKALEAWK